MRERIVGRRPLALGITAVIVAGGFIGATRAYGSPPQPAGEQQEFAKAAAEYHVPVSVLMGVSYQESLWQGHAGEYNTGGGYGPMNLTDATRAMFDDGDAGMAGRSQAASEAANPALHTLGAASALTGIPAAQLRDDSGQNIRGGAALLASYERKIVGGTPQDPADWYGAVARYSQDTDQGAAKSFADDVYSTISSGARQTVDGRKVSLAGDSAVRPLTSQLPLLRLKRLTPTLAQCPATVQCTFTPAASTNYQVANRPADGLKIQYIVIHDTESSYASTISTFQDSSSGVSANYVMQSATGDVTQMVPDQDIAFHDGNYWFNMHAIGIEHEGYAAQGATWYTQTQYEATAQLVRYLAAEYDIPLDREHIIGHDNVPGPQSSYVAGMHWDPGPYWNWTYFMQLLGAPIPTQGSGTVPRVGSAVTITPNFQTNEQTVQVCSAPPTEGGIITAGSNATPTPTPSPSSTCTSQTQDSNFLYVRTAPSTSAPLFSDPALHTDGSPGTTDIDDWGDTIDAGQQFVVAGQQGDWTAIWYSGAKVWFYNPSGVNTTPAYGVTIVSPTGSTAAPTYGEAYPQPSEYPSNLSPDLSPPLSMYTLPVGQAYVATAPPANADDFFPGSPETVVKGAATYWTIQYNHRVVLVDAADVTSAS